MKKKQKAPKHPIDLKTIPSSKVDTSITANPLKSIRIDRPFLLPLFVREAMQRLSEAGYSAYLVGGCVRDFLLGREPKDYDIVTHAEPDALCALFPKAITVGKAFGVIKVPTGTHPPLLEIATFREDLEYVDHRHPKSVVFKGPEEDARRRDFTINSLFYDPKTLRVLDFTGGLDDLKNHLIRAIGRPSDRFREDALRLLRAVRFKTRFNFDLDPETAAAIESRARLITKVSSERIRDELTLMWQGARSAQSLEWLSKLGLLKFILPEVEALRGLPQIPAWEAKEDVWSHLLRTMEFLEKQSPGRSAVLAWATVLHEIGKPIVSRQSGGNNYNHHELEGAKMVEKVASRLKMSRLEGDWIKAMVSDSLKFKDVFKMRESTLQRFLMEPHFEELLAFHKADAMASEGNLAFYEFCASRLESMKKSPETEFQRLVDGNDLIQLGLKPGPEFSEIIRVVEDLGLEKKLTTKEEALEYILKNYVK